MTPLDCPIPKIGGGCKPRAIIFYGDRVIPLWNLHRPQCNFFLNWGKIRERIIRLLSQTNSIFYFLGPESLCKISSKSNQNCGRRSVYRQTHRITVLHKWFYNLSHAMLLAMGQITKKLTESHWTQTPAKDRNVLYAQVCGYLLYAMQYRRRHRRIQRQVKEMTRMTNVDWIQWPQRRRRRCMKPSRKTSSCC